MTRSTATTNDEDSFDVFTENIRITEKKIVLGGRKKKCIKQGRHKRKLISTEAVEFVPYLVVKTDFSSSVLWKEYLLSHLHADWQHMPLLQESITQNN